MSKHRNEVKGTHTHTYHQKKRSETYLLVGGRKHQRGQGPDRHVKAPQRGEAGGVHPVQEVEEPGGIDGVLRREEGAGQEEVLEEGEDGLVLLGRVRTAEPAGAALFGGGGGGGEEVGLVLYFLVGVWGVCGCFCVFCVFQIETHTYMHTYICIHYTPSSPATGP